MKGCAFRALHAMGWPQDLRTIGHRHLRERRRAGVGFGKAFMPRRVPILRQHART